jgi:hypothetical protein
MSVKVGEEVEKTVWDIPIELDEQTKQMLLVRAQDEITVDEMDELLLQWVIVKIIREDVEERLNTATEEDK